MVLDRNDLIFTIETVLKAAGHVWRPEIEPPLPEVAADAVLLLISRKQPATPPASEPSRDAVIEASWTAIEDGLPTEDGEFLVAYRWNDVDGPFIKSGEFFAEDDDPAAWLVDGISGEPIIVAWMPIPHYQPKTAKDNDNER